MKSLSAGILEEIQKPHGDSPWTDLFFLPIDSTPVASPVICLVKAQQSVTWQGLTFYPYPISRSPLESNSDGSFPTFTVTIGDPLLLLPHYLEQGHGFVGLKMSIFRVNLAHLGANDVVRLDAYVAGANLVRGGVGLRMEVQNLHKALVPQDVYTRDGCRHEFGQDGCGVNLAALPEEERHCDKSRARCQTIGGILFALGYARLWPQRYGGKPGIPRDVR